MPHTQSSRNRHSFPLYLGDNTPDPPGLSRNKNTPANIHRLLTEPVITLSLSLSFAYPLTRL